MTFLRRAPAAASGAPTAVSALDLMVGYACNTASGSSASAGTYSTTYTSSRDSVVSSEPDLASQLLRIHLSSGVEDDIDEQKLNKIDRLVKEICHGDGDIGAVVERWLSELGVGWVLDLSDGPAAGTSLLLRAQRNLSENWVRVLNEITGSTLRFVREQDLLGPDQLQLVFKETVLKMLPFVDALLAAADLLDAGTDTADATTGAEAPSQKLRTLLCVNNALYNASIAMQYCFQCWNSSEETEAEWSDEVLTLLSAKEQRLDEAVWSTMEVRTSILNDGDDDDKWGIQTPKGSPYICKAIRSLITYIKYLGNNYRSLNRIVGRAAELGKYYVPEQDKTDPWSTLIMEMVSSVQEKLDKRSETFPDHSLRSLFLINNTHFIWQQLYPLYLDRVSDSAVLTAKIEDYIQKYLQVSWEPILSCLHNDTPRCFRTNSTLPKFDSEFQKTYTAQKLWKVPDPGLRSILRRAIIEKVVSGFTKYLEDNNVTNPKVTPQEREKMLRELFEG